MAVTLVATPGDPNANSYATVARADAIAETRLFGATWADTSETDQEPTKSQALISATAELDTLPWLGVKTDPDQPLEWPRTGVVDRNGNPIPDDVIPRAVELATIELALRRVKLGDPEAKNDSEGIKKLKAGTIEVEFDVSKNRLSNGTTVVPLTLIPETVLTLIRHLTAWNTEVSNPSMMPLKNV